MLVLMRRLEESVIIDEHTEMKVIKIQGNQVHLGFIAPKEINIYRKEIYDKLKQENHTTPREHSTEFAAYCFQNFGRVVGAQVMASDEAYMVWREES